MTAVHEVMSISPVTVTPATTVAELLALFDRHDFNAFPVLDQGGRLLGVVSKLDVLDLALRSGASGETREALSTVPVERLMQTEVVSVEARDRIADAGAIMVAEGLRSLPVVERQERGVRLVGVLSRGDVLRGLRFQLLEGNHAGRGSK